MHEFGGDGLGGPQIGLPGNHALKEHLATSGIQNNITWAGASFLLSGASAIMGFASGQKADRYAQKMVQKQYEADIANWQYTYQEATDAHEFALEDIELAEWNFKQQAKFKDEQAMKEWIDQDRERLWDYNQQVKAYNASVESYGVQLDYNDIANDLATGSAARAYQDQLTLLGYQFENLDIEQGRAEKGIGLKRKGLQSDLKEGKRALGINKKQINANLSAKQAELSAKLELQRLQGFDFEGKVRMLGQAGASARRNVVAARAASQRLEYALADAAMRAEQTSGLDLEAIANKLESLGDKIDLQDEQLVEELYNTRVDVEFSAAQMADTLKSQNLQFEADAEKRKLEKYGADLRAREMLAPTPVLRPQASKPLETPEPKLLKPRAPRKGPKPIHGAAVTGHGLAGLAGGLSSMASAAAALG